MEKGLHSMKAVIPLSLSCRLFNQVYLGSCLSFSLYISLSFCACLVPHTRIFNLDGIACAHCFAMIFLSIDLSFSWRKVCFGSSVAPLYVFNLLYLVDWIYSTFYRICLFSYSLVENFILINTWCKWVFFWWRYCSYGKFSTAIFSCGFADGYADIKGISIWWDIYDFFLVLL